MSENLASEESSGKLYPPFKSTLIAFAFGVAITAVFLVPLINQQKHLVAKCSKYEWLYEQQQDIILRYENVTEDLRGLHEY